MPPSRTVAPYSPARTPIGARLVVGHGKHPPPFIRDTNTIEALHRQIRKTIKTRGHFPTEEAARKLIYLSIINAQKKWRQTYNWSAALLSFKTHFEDRLPRHTESRTPSRGRHRPRRPVRRACGLLLECLHDHPLDVLVADRARLPRPRLIVQPVDPAAREPAPPLADRVGVTAQLGRDLRARPTLRRRQHDPAAKRQRLRTLPTPSPPLQRDR